jgi:hypothetical protein
MKKSLAGQETQNSQYSLNIVDVHSYTQPDQEGLALKCSYKRTYIYSLTQLTMPSCAGREKYIYKFEASRAQAASHAVSSVTAPKTSFPAAVTV